MFLCLEVLLINFSLLSPPPSPLYVTLYFIVSLKLNKANRKNLLSLISLCWRSYNRHSRLVKDDLLAVGDNGASFLEGSCLLAFPKIFKADNSNGK